MTSGRLIRVALAASGLAMRWRLDRDRQCLESDAGYLITKAYIERGYIERRQEPVYRAFTPTGGFLGASGEQKQAERLCIEHNEVK